MGAPRSPTIGRSAQTSTWPSRVKKARYSSFVILRFCSAFSIPGGSVRLAEAMARSTSSGRESKFLMPRGLIVLRTFSPDDEEFETTTASRSATDLGRPLTDESAGISPSENTAMTLAASSPSAESLRGLNRISEGSISGDAAARSYSVRAPAATRAPRLRSAVSTISFSVHGLACRTALLSSGSVELASMMGLDWLHMSEMAPPFDLLNEVELSERKRSPPPLLLRLPLLLAFDDDGKLFTDALPTD